MLCIRTKRVLFTMNCWNLAIPLRAIGYNWFVWVVRALREKRPKYEHNKVILLHENSRPHVAKVIKKYLETLKWDVLLHLPYSPDIAPFDYWFRRMQQVTSFAEIENWLQNWIASKDESFFWDGIQKLPERWEKVVGSDRQY